AAANLLDAAETAVEAAEQALTDAIADGKVEQSEIDALEAAIDNAKAELGQANDAIAALPEGTAKEALESDAKDLQDRLDAIEIPAVDADDFDAAANLLADAKDAVDAAV